MVLPEEPNEKAQRLGRNLFYSFAGQFVYLVTQLGVLSALAHYRGPVAVGQLGLAMALATPLFLWSSSGFRTAQAADVGVDYTFAQYGGVRVLLTITAILATLLAGMAFSDAWSTFTVMCVVALTKSAESISSLSYGAFQQAGRMGLVAASLILRGCLTLPLMVLFLELGAPTAVALTAQLIVWTAVGLLIDYRRASKIAVGAIVVPKIELANSWKLIRFTAPLSFGLLSNSLQMSVPRLFLERYLGLEALGIFTAVGYFQQAGVTASNSVSQAIVNRFARLSRNNRYKEIYSICIKLAVMFVLTGVTGASVCYFWGGLIVKILFGLTDQSAGRLLFIVSLAVTLRVIASLPQTILFAERRFRLFLIFQIISLGMTTLLCVFVIPRWQIVGAGYILVSTALFRLVFMEFFAVLRRGKARV